MKLFIVETKRNEENFLDKLCQHQYIVTVDDDDDDDIIIIMSSTL